MKQYMLASAEAWLTQMGQHSGHKDMLEGALAPDAMVLELALAQGL